MQVVLLEDVRALGRKGDIVKVNDGYARNLLLPKKLGIEATPANLSQLKQQKAREARLEAQQLEEAKKLSAELQSKKIVITAKCGEGGKLFGAISSKEIAQEVKRVYGLDLDKKKIVLPEPIKTLGLHTVTAKLYREVTAELQVEVSEEK